MNENKQIALENQLILEYMLLSSCAEQFYRQAHKQIDHYSVKGVIHQLRATNSNTLAALNSLRTAPSKLHTPRTFPQALARQFEIGIGQLEEQVESELIQKVITQENQRITWLIRQLNSVSNASLKTRLAASASDHRILIDKLTHLTNNHRLG